MFSMGQNSSHESLGSFHIGYWDTTLNSEYFSIPTQDNIRITSSDLFLIDRMKSNSIQGYISTMNTRYKYHQFNFMSFSERDYSVSHHQSGFNINIGLKLNYLDRRITNVYSHQTLSTSIELSTSYDHLNFISRYHQYFQGSKDVIIFIMSESYKSLTTQFSFKKDEAGVTPYIFGLIKHSFITVGIGYNLQKNVPVSQLDLQFESWVLRYGYAFHYHLGMSQSFGIAFLY